MPTYVVYATAKLTVKAEEKLNAANIVFTLKNLPTGDENIVIESVTPIGITEKIEPVE